MVAICVSEPIGLEQPRRMLSTPAMKVVATAPSPGVMTPSLPDVGRTLTRGVAVVPGTLCLLVSFEQRQRTMSSCGAGFGSLPRLACSDDARASAADFVVTSTSVSAEDCKVAGGGSRVARHTKAMR